MPIGVLTPFAPNRLESYFPEFGEGELVYSVLARFGRHRGLDQTQLRQAFFGSVWHLPRAVTPQQLDMLAACLPATVGLTGLDLAERHTTLPYYLAFMPEEKRERALQGMLGEGRAGYVVGTRAGPVGDLLRLRFCRECLPEMMAQVGEWYWRRDHQIPIATMCPEHGTELRLSTIELPTKAYSPADRATCPDDAPSVLEHAPMADRELLMHLSTRARDLLERRVVLPDDYFSTVLEKGFREKGYRRGQSSQQRNWSSLEKFALGLLEPVEEAVKQDRTAKTSPMWLYNLFVPSQPYHTDRVLLAEHVLRCAPTIARPIFGQGPWICVNPLAEHFGTNAIVDPPVIERRKTVAEATFHCTCGATSTQRRTCKGERFFDLSRMLISTYGRSLSDLVRDAAKNDWSMRETASRACLAPIRFLLQLEREGVPFAEHWLPLTVRTRAELKQARERSRRNRPPR